MAKYTIESDYCSVFGMDTHARSTTVKGRDLSTGETRTKRFGDCPSAESIMEWMTAHFTPPFYAAYESGCTGFHLARELRAVGVACDVVAATSIARSDEDRKQKNDRRDAARILSELLNPESSISLVWVPDPECEAARDLVRCRLDVSDLNSELAKMAALPRWKPYVDAPQGAVRPPRRPGPARQQGQDRRRQRAHTLDLGRREDGPGRAARAGRAIIETNPGEGVQPMEEPARDACAPPPATAGQRRHARCKSGSVPVASGQPLPNELECGPLARYPRI